MKTVVSRSLWKIKVARWQENIVLACGRRAHPWQCTLFNLRRDVYIRGHVQSVVHFFWSRCAVRIRLFVRVLWTMLLLQKCTEGRIWLFLVKSVVSLDPKYCRLFLFGVHIPHHTISSKTILSPLVVTTGCVCYPQRSPCFVYTYCWRSQDAPTKQRMDIEEDERREKIARYWKERYLARNGRRIFGYIFWGFWVGWEKEYLWITRNWLLFVFVDLLCSKRKIIVYCMDAWQ